MSFKVSPTIPADILSALEDLTSEVLSAAEWVTSLAVNADVVIEGAPAREYSSALKH